MNEHGSHTEASWWSGPRLDGAIAVFLLVLTFAAYYPVLDCQFVNYDDNIYVTENGAAPGSQRAGDSLGIHSCSRGKLAPAHASVAALGLRHL